ncbi:MAG: hypothetical protein J7K48_08085 [Thermococcus sp.]|nr:hypothetical protein [Thermococcus sp.]
MNLFAAIMAGFAYGLSMYGKKALNGQEFNKAKLLATLIVSVLTAIIMETSGMPINEMTFQQQFLVYAGAIPLVENLIKIFVRGMVELAARRPPKPPAYVGLNN